MKEVASLKQAVEAVRARRRHEARARVMHPELDDIDVALLEDYRVNTDPVSEDVRNIPFQAERSPRWTARKRPKAPDAVYVDGALRPVEADEGLRGPEITVEEERLYPSVSVPPVKGAIYHFEFDTSPAFDSPNLWRWPMLLSVDYVEDAATRDGQKVSLVKTTQRGVTGKDSRVRFPFRVTAMRLPGWGRMTFDEMQRQSRALTHGLRGEAAIREIYAYVRQIYTRASESVHKPAIDTFATGMGECGHVNDLAGAFLEMSSIRFRGVSGFPPKARVLTNGRGGHSAIEALNPATGKWSYFDPYLDILAIDVSAAELAGSEIGETPVYTITKARQSSAYNPDITVAELFEYRRYWDKRTRRQPASMLQLFGRVDAYGVGWKLSEAPEFPADALFAEQRTIHVRARYVMSGGRVTPWAVISFEIRPRDLMPD